MTADELYKQFRLVFEMHYSALCVYSLSITGQKEVSEDIVQEVFLKVWETKKELIPKDEVRFYLFASVRNNSMGYQTKLRRVSIVPFEAMEHTQTPQEDTLEYESEQKAFRDKLAAGIQSLPPKCKDVFLLSRIGKMSYQEIADHSGISVKTVENQIGKALKLLRAFVLGVKLLFPLFFFWKP